MRKATKKEVLLAISMSQFMKRNHIEFMPVGKSFTRTLDQVRSLGLVEPADKGRYRLTEKGVNELKIHNLTVTFKSIDDEIDGFVDAL